MYSSICHHKDSGLIAPMWPECNQCRMASWPRIIRKEGKRAGNTKMKGAERCSSGVRIRSGFRQGVC